MGTVSGVHTYLGYQVSYGTAPAGDLGCRHRGQSRWCLLIDFVSVLMQRKKEDILDCTQYRARGLPYNGHTSHIAFEPKIDPTRR